jgi:uncharacterized radical SAM protein YgiQ
VGLAQLRRSKFDHPFLPTSRAEMRERGWDELDIVLISGDAYVDHPAFGPPLIGRFLEARGFRVGIIAQPDWQSAEPFRALGRPRLLFGIAAGNLDSMLNRLTAQKKVRSEDQYSPGGRTGMRPDRATIVYAQRAREAFPGVPIVIGGIEASLRRLAHYDYWSDTVRRSVLLDAKADLLIYGMGEAPVWEVARRLAAGEDISQIRDARGTCYAISGEAAQKLEARPSEYVSDGRVVVLPSYEAVREDKVAFAKMSRAFHHETNPYNARPLLQRHGDRAVYYNPPSLPLADGDGKSDDRKKADVAIDELYDLPFNRAAHPMYGGERIPAFDTVRDSVVLMRGCFGGCTFCSITEHEGRIIQSRSKDSVLRELRRMSRMEGFSGVVSDLGGPTANMYRMRCKTDEIESACRRLSCVHPDICPNLETDHAPLVDLMRAARKEVRKVFIASGVRYDLALRSPEYIEELAQHHTGGQLSVAPEHVDRTTLRLMKKPGIEAYETFTREFACASEKAGKEQYQIPYFISGHPGSTLEAMIELALWLKSQGIRPRQVQDFIPTPMSLAATMYYSGIDPLTMNPVYTARGLREKKLQKALLLYWDPAQHALAREALLAAGRRDLIGRAPHCLVPPGPTNRDTPRSRTRRSKSRSPSWPAASRHRRS